MQTQTGTETLNPVAVTGLLVASLRAEESARPDRLFEDPFAAKLAGDVGRRALDAYRAALPIEVPVIEVRTRFFDDALLRACDGGARQVAILAAGMDARAYRLAWPPGARVFELDQPHVLAHKARTLADAAPACHRRAVACDLARDWGGPLLASGFHPAMPTAWLVEGLLQYLDAGAVQRLFASIDRLSAQGSVILFDAVSPTLLEAPPMASALAWMRDLGAPWVFATDDPAALLPRRWAVVDHDPADEGRRWGRWPFPAPPPDFTGAPRGHLVEARAR
jgi:methyltransferase (TIGR00027 family)